MNQENSRLFVGRVNASVLDYPPYICTVVFTPGCVFRCPFCFNKDIVLDETGVSYTASDIFAFLEDSNKGFNDRLVDAICISGGEPLIHADALVSFCKCAHEQQYKVKIDTCLCGGDITKLLPYIDGVSVSLKAEDSFLDQAVLNLSALNQSSLAYKELRLILTGENKNILKDMYTKLLDDGTINAKAWSLYISLAQTVDNSFGTFTELSTEQLIQLQYQQ